MRIRLMQREDCGPVADVLNHAISTGIAHFGTVMTNEDEVRADWEATRAVYPWLVAGSDDDSFIGFAKASAWKSRKAYAWTVESGIYLVEGAQGNGDIAPAGYKHGQWVDVRIYQKLLSPCDGTDIPMPIRDVQSTWDELEAKKQVNT